jgi:hypothetical protein
MCGENSCNVFLLFIMVLWVPIFAMLCRRAMRVLRHTSLLLGLSHVGVFSSFFPFDWSWFHVIRLFFNNWSIVLSQVFSGRLVLVCGEVWPI